MVYVNLFTVFIIIFGNLRIVCAVFTKWWKKNNLFWFHLEKTMWNYCEISRWDNRLSSRTYEFYFEISLFSSMMCEVHEKWCDKRECFTASWYHKNEESMTYKNMRSNFLADGKLLQRSILKFYIISISIHVECLCFYSVLFFSAPRY